MSLFKDESTSKMSAEDKAAILAQEQSEQGLKFGKVNQRSQRKPIDFGLFASTSKQIDIFGGKE